jgi:cytidylate kinase
VDPADSRQVADLLRRLRIEGVVEGGCVRFRINGEDPGAQIRSEAVSERVSEFSAVAAVRGEVVRRLRETAALGRIVMEGRDIGSVVLPEAGFKFYLDADPEERARRRQSEMAERKETATVARVLDSLKRRDAKDAGRELAPLTIPKGAEVVDTTRMTIDEVVDRLFRRITG